MNARWAKHDYIYCFTLDGFKRTKGTNQSAKTDSFLFVFFLFYVQQTKQKEKLQFELICYSRLQFNDQH